MEVGHDTVCWLLLNCFPSGRFHQSGASLHAAGATRVRVFWFANYTSIQYDGLHADELIPALADAVFNQFGEARFARVYKATINIHTATCLESALMQALPST